MGGYLLIVLLVLVSLLSLALGFLITRRYFLSRLSNLNYMVQELLKSNFSHRLNIYKSREFNEIAQALNELAMQIDNRITQIINDKEKLQAIFNSMEEGVIILSPEGHLEHLSPQLKRMLELRSLETKGRLYWEVITNTVINTAIKTALTDRTALRREIKIISPSEAYFIMQISPVINALGVLKNLVVVFHEISELKKLERLRSEFVANVSHELKTPLTAIKGFVETLQDTPYEDKQSHQRFLNIIAQQAQRLEDLVNDLLTLSGAESKELKLDLQAENLTVIIDSLALFYKNALSKHPHQLKVDIDASLPKILVDRNRFEQVLHNLIDNAIKYTPSGGLISIKAQKEGEFIRIDIQDNGIGIASEHLPRIFERFYRVDKARAKDTGGTGLGLAIVKHLTLLHQGKIAVKSLPSQGSCFSVYFPFQRA